MNSSENNFTLDLGHRKGEVRSNENTHSWWLDSELSNQLSVTVLATFTASSAAVLTIHAPDADTDPQQLSHPSHCFAHQDLTNLAIISSLAADIHS